MRTLLHVVGRKEEGTSYERSARALVQLHGKREALRIAKRIGRTSADWKRVAAELAKLT